MAEGATQAFLLSESQFPDRRGAASRSTSFGNHRRAYRRDRARDRHIFGDDVAELLELTVQDESFALERERSVLEECVGKLPTDQRKLVDTAYEPGVKMNDLARQLGWTPMALYKKLHRIRLQLMECIRRELTEIS